MNKRVYPIFALCFILLALAACAPSAKTLTGADRDAVLAYSEPKTDNVLAGLNANDYAAFTRDFDDKMKSASTKASFADLQTKVPGKIGKYVSRQVDSVTQQGEFIVVQYTAKFESEDGVTVRVVFDVAEPHLVSGLWFDSAKLRQ